MEFRVFNGHIEMDGQPIAKLLDKVNEWEVKDELKNYDGSNAGCDCDEKSAYDDGYENGEKDKERAMKSEVFGILCRMDASGEISPRQANKILVALRSSDRVDNGDGDKDRNRVEGHDAVYWHAAHALLATKMNNTKEKISMALGDLK